jgi:hypothetical protein
MVDQLHGRDVAGKRINAEWWQAQRTRSKSGDSENGSPLLIMFRAGRSRAVLLNLNQFLNLICDVNVNGHWNSSKMILALPFYFILHSVLSLVVRLYITKTLIVAQNMRASVVTIWHFCRE